MIQLETSMTRIKGNGKVIYYYIYKSDVSYFFIKMEHRDKITPLQLLK